MNVCLIPARGGSKRIARKNVRPFRGQPLIAWSIQAALASGVFDRVIVSTDDEEIARVAAACGAEAPFRRPAELADDHATTSAVVAHALGWMEAQGIGCARLCCLYATAPFVRPDDLRAGLDLLREHAAPTVLTVTSFDFPIFRALRLDERGALEMIWPEHRSTRSQDLPEACHDAGQFYWLDAERFRRDSQLYCPGMRPLVLPRYRVQDIDTEEDFRRAELLHQLIEESEA